MRRRILNTMIAMLLAVGGLLAIAVSVIAGKQAGGLKMSLFARMMRRRRLLAERHDQPGLMIAVEGADDAQVDAVEETAEAVSEDATHAEGSDADKA